jgi:hypothetical protein
MVGPTIAIFDVPLPRVVVAKDRGFHHHLPPPPAALGLWCMTVRTSLLALADADHGDACRHRYLAEGMVIDFIAPSLSSDVGGNPMSSSPDQAARCLGFVIFLDFFKYVLY